VKLSEDEDFLDMLEHGDQYTGQIKKTLLHIEQLESDSELLNDLIELGWIRYARREGETPREAIEAAIKEWKKK
jgi:hypothetical protein